MNNQEIDYTNRNGWLHSAIVRITFLGTLKMGNTTLIGSLFNINTGLL